MMKFRKNYLSVALACVCLTAGCIEGGLKESLNDVMQLSAEFSAQCKVSSSTTSSSRRIEIELMNVLKSEYKEMSVSRLASCALVRYCQMISDSTRNTYDSFVVRVGTSAKDGMMTQTYSENRIYTNTDIERIDSLISVCTEYLTEASQMKTFDTKTVFRDTMMFTDSMIVILDSANVALFGKSISEVKFMGYQQNTTEGMGTIWMKVVRSDAKDIFIFHMDEVHYKVIGMGMNLKSE